ncbi:MAG: hypothetical protein QOJ19_3537 [Acidimicrobiia bacterium]|nr:hypothetical protein [Acidimicrobiia bacterium]
MRSLPVRVVWIIFGVVLVATIATYWRLPAGGTYQFDDSGPSGAVSRSITYLNFPVAIAAVGMLLAVGRSRWAVLAGALCLVAFWPGVSSDDHLTARWINLPAAVGAVLAVIVTWQGPSGRPAPRGRRDPSPGMVSVARPGTVRVLALGVLAAWAVPWIVAAIGFYGNDLPIVGRLIRAAQPTPGEPALASVHRGLHEGLFGLQLAATALLVSLYRPLRRPARAYLAGLLVYGVAISAADGWNEQVVKRGAASFQLPNVLYPALSWPWAGVLVLAAVVYVSWSWQERRSPRSPVGT